MNRTLGLGLLIAACAARGWAAVGVMELKGTAPQSSIAGIIIFQDTAGGLKVNAMLAGVPAGLHAFHIHEFGSCADLGKAAGGHFNPMSAPHGQVLKDGLEHAHAGDLGNIKVGKDGKATLEVVVPGISLAAGPYTVGGRAVILHEKADDFSQPLGNAGGRIGCGLIVITGSGAPATAAAPIVAPQDPTLTPAKK
jgi:Cu-Zn family superoxide dismutase